MAAVQITPFVVGENTLGEGPIWDRIRQCLWWVDIEEQRIYQANALGQAVKSWRMPERVGFVLPHRDGRLWAGFRSGMHLIDLNETDYTLERLDSINEEPYVRFNDACLDAEGNVYSSTMDMRSEELLGRIIRYQANGLTTVLTTAFVIGNGPAISPDQRTLYIVESSGHIDRPKGVYAASITEVGTLTDERLLVDWQTQDTSLDGLITDHTGNLWIGEYGGHRLRQFSPDGALLQAIDLPVWNPTKPALGADEKTLFLTSARQGAPAEKLAQYPLTGSVLKIVLP